MAVQSQLFSSNPQGQGMVLSGVENSRLLASAMNCHLLLPTHSGTCAKRRRLHQGRRHGWQVHIWCAPLLLTIGSIAMGMPTKEPDLEHNTHVGRSPGLHQSLVREPTGFANRASRTPGEYNKCQRQHICGDGKLRLSR